MRPAAKILLAEAAALRPILERTAPSHFDRPTVCAGWSVRDVLAHCGAVLSHVAAGTVHGFTPEDNQGDVDARRGWSLPDVLDELLSGYTAASKVIDAAGGRLDGVGIGEWMHGGDVREALDEPDAYVSEGSELAVGLLLARSRMQQRPALTVVVDGGRHTFGCGEPRGRVITDLETFMRLTGDRRPAAGRYRCEDCAPEDLRLFS